MATRQDLIKEGSVEGAAEKLAALRNTGEDDAPLPEAPVVEAAEEEIVESTEVEATEEIVPPDEPEVQEPAEESEDIFADELEEDATQTLEPPAALSKEGKELFSQLDPELAKQVEERIKAAERGATQKVQQTAEREKELNAQAEEVLKLRDDYLARLQSLDATKPEPPDPDLADINSDKYDPDEFNAQNARYLRAVNAFEQKQAERQKLESQKQEQAARTQQETLQRHAMGIQKLFPSWNSQEKFSEGVSAVHNFLVEEGLSREAAGRVTDPVAFKLAYMAKQYKLAKAKARGVKAPKPAAPSGKPRTQTATNVTKLRESLTESGSVTDAAALLSATRTARR